MDTLGHVRVTCEAGVHGDFRGAVRPGRRPRWQVTLMEAECWAAAMADLGLDLPWHLRRANLLVSGLRLPRISMPRGGTVSAVVCIGASLRIAVTGECDPCSRMEEIAPGLKAALLPDWRGGITGQVIADGEIAIGDHVRIET